MDYWRHMAAQIWVNIGSSNGFLPGDTKPLPEPNSNYYQWSPLAFTWGQFHKKYTPDITGHKVFENCIFENTAASPRG